MPYIDETLMKLLLNQKIVMSVDIQEQITTPGFLLENKFSIGIDNKCLFKNIKNFSDLIGLKVQEIQEKENQYIRFIFDKNKYLEVDMSDNGYTGPEALQIQRDKNIWIIR